MLTTLQDLKGDNVLVGPSGICKLTDFGIYNHEGSFICPECVRTHGNGT